MDQREAGPRVDQFGKLSKYIGHLVAPFPAPDINDDLGIGPDDAANVRQAVVEVERARGAGGQALRPGSPARPALDGAPHQELTTGSTAVEIAQVNAADAEIVDAELVHDNRQDGSN